MITSYWRREEDIQRSNMFMKCHRFQSYCWEIYKFWLRLFHRFFCDVQLVRMQTQHVFNHDVKRWNHDTHAIPTQFNRCSMLYMLRQEIRSRWPLAMTLFHRSPDFRGSRPLTQFVRMHRTIYFPASSMELKSTFLTLVLAIESQRRRLAYTFTARDQHVAQWTVHKRLEITHLC